MRHSIEFKRAAVQKFLSRGTRSSKEVVDEIGVPYSTIYQWKNDFAKFGDMKKLSKNHNRSAQEKIKLLIEYDNLVPDQRGEFLRKNGLYEEHLIEWRNLAELALSPKNTHSQDYKDLLNEQKKVKQLESEIRRKDRALAEASALLILKKKVDLIWGTGEEE